MKKHIKAELLMLKQNGLATQNYKQKLNRLIDSPTITFDDWRKQGPFVMALTYLKCTTLELYQPT